MQKVEGSSPFIRFANALLSGAFVVNGSPAMRLLQAQVWKCRNGISMGHDALPGR